MTKLTSPADVIWQTPRYIPDLPDGAYGARCHLEMEPPIQDPIEVNPSTSIRIENGWVNATDAATAIANAVHEVGEAYDTIVGLAFVHGKVQFIVIWEHTSPEAPEANRAN